jgi:glycine oxidase
VNIVVIGAGIIGASIAEALASRGARVTVIDMRSAGRGASQASAGLLAPYNEAREQPALLALATQSLDLYDDFIDRIRERSGLTMHYAREGTLHVASTTDEATELLEMRSWLTGQDVQSEWIDAAALRQFEPAAAEQSAGGLLIRGQGFVAAGALVRAIVQAARLQGAVFEAPVEAVRVERAGAPLEIHAGDRRLTTDAVVIAAGSWSGRVRIAGEPPLPVRPIRGQLLQLTWTNGALPARPIWGSRVYTVPWAPDTLLVGATVEDVGFDERSTVEGVRDLLDAVGEMLPASRHSAIADIRVGLRPSTADGLPLIGPLLSDSRICLATGHYRSGVLLAPITAKMVADHFYPTNL